MKIYHRNHKQNQRTETTIVSQSERTGKEYIHQYYQNHTDENQRTETTI